MGASEEAARREKRPRRVALPMPDRELVDEDLVAAGAVTNVAQYLKGLRFPAGKEDVARKAQENGADPSALAEIRALPDARRYGDPVDLFDAIGDEVRKLRLED